jgi:hypothetical protein
VSINYNFPSEKRAYVRRTVDFHENISLAGYNRIAFWVGGDNSTNNLWLDLKDDTGREVGVVATNLNFLGWKSVIVNLDDFAEQGINIAAINQMRISIDNNAKNAGSGYVTLAHLSLLF